MDIDRLVGVFERRVPLRPEALAAAETRLWIGVTDCRTGEVALVRATPGNIFSLLRATMALPVAYGKIVPVEGAVITIGLLVLQVRKITFTSEDQYLFYAHVVDLISALISARWASALRRESR